MVTIDDLKADPAACRLLQRSESPPTVPYTGDGSSSASLEGLARFVIEIPGVLIHRAICYGQLRYGEKDDVCEVLAALARLGYRPTIAQTKHGKIMSF